MVELAMIDGSAGWLGTAAALLLLAHLVRAFRWSLLFPRSTAEPDQTGLLLSLGAGYAVNAIVPLRVGEIVRGVLASRIRRTRFAEVMATIVAERTADLSVVTALIIGSWYSGPGTGFPILALASTALVAGLAATAIALRHSAGLRRLLWAGVGIFNPRVRIAVADFAWSTAEILVGGTLLRWQFSLATFAMWSIYFAAYGCFARAIDGSLATVVEALLLRPLTSILLSSTGAAIPRSDLHLFVLAPLAAIIVAQLLWSRQDSTDGTIRRLRYRGPGPHFATSTRYNHSGVYAGFLDALFSDARSAVTGFGRSAVGDCVVHGYYRGGSDALTALVETPDRMLIRKFAMGTAALKLKEQAKWLARHSGGAMPLVPVLNAQVAAGTFSYDMPLWERTMESYEAVHSRPLSDSRGILLRVLESVDRLHGSSKTEVARTAQVEQYIERKVSDNAAQLVRFGRQCLQGDLYEINGTQYGLEEWNLLQDREWLTKQISSRRTSPLHGDLTLENIVIAPDHEAGFYVIDPNPENIFDTPLIDWSKLMQSLHLGYEGLNKSSPMSLSNQRIELPIVRSEAYAELHKLLEGEIVSRFSSEGLREVYFHELVNYLRLTPYKTRQSVERGLAFFACTSMLLRKYVRAYA
jgi:hypothetical protein